MTGNDEWLAGQRRSQQQSERLLAQLWAQREAAAGDRPWSDLVDQTPPVAPAAPPERQTSPPPNQTQPTSRSAGRGAHRVTRSARGRRVLLAGVVLVAAGLVAAGLLLLLRT